MIYQILRLPLAILFFFFYRRIYFAGRHNIPKNAPTLVASNHSTAFMEQMLVAVLQSRSVYFWAKGSIFDENPLLLPIFKQMHVVPIWKPEAGLKKMQQNKEIFENSKNILLTDKMFYIAPEGLAWTEKRLMPFKTGTARLALLAAAESHFEKNIFILPTGVNYTYPTQFRSEVLISVGKPINVKNYKALYVESQQLAIKKLTEDLKDAITKEVVVIEDKEDDELVEQLYVLCRNEYHNNDEIFSNNNNRLRLEQEVANTCNRLDTTEKNELKNQAKHYFDALKKYELKDKAVQQKGAFYWSKFLKFLALLPFALLGWMGGFLPVFVARFLRNKSIQNKQFLAPMTLVYSLITWVVYSLLIGIMAGFWIGWVAWIIPLVLVGLQYIAFINREKWVAIFDNYKYAKWKEKEPKEAQLLEQERTVLMARYMECKRNFCISMEFFS